MPADALRGAVNVDILDSGKLKRRRGSTQVVPLAGAHSGWSHKMLTNSYYVAGMTMFELAPTLVSTPIVTGLMPGAKVAYLYLNGEVFWSNGIVTGRILNGVNKPWGVESPNSTFSLVSTLGAMPAGTYQIALTYRSNTGEESGSRSPRPITIPADSGISVTNLPMPVDASVTHRHIYCTLQNGDVLYKIATVPVAQTSFSFSTLPTPGVTLKTTNMDPMPAGSIIAYRKGVIYVAAGPYIFHSEPLRYGLTSMEENFYMYPQDVSVMLATEEGLHVCADKTYFLENAGTPDVVQHIRFPFGGVAGTGLYLPDNMGVAWFSPRGQVVAKGAEAVLTTDKMHAPGLATTGVAFVREQQGLRQIVTVTHQNEVNPLEYTGA